jgi:predicted nucleic acid-binding protein
MVMIHTGQSRWQWPGAPRCSVSTKTPCRAPICSRHLRDEADNHLIELAVAGQATHLVTRNLRDLVRSDLKFPGIQVLGPADFLLEKPT